LRAIGQFFRLVAKGAALELVTGGFYRFWLATDIRRHLWSNTVIDGDAAEYTGRGKELLIGFLFAMAILVPIYLAYFLIGVQAERQKGCASVPLFVLFYGFAQFAIYRARRYPELERPTVADAAGMERSQGDLQFEELTATPAVGSPSSPRPAHPPAPPAAPP
jgi:hypothetical protein